MGNNDYTNKSLMSISKNGFTTNLSNARSPQMPVIDYKPRILNIMAKVNCSIVKSKTGKTESKSLYQSVVDIYWE